MSAGKQSIPGEDISLFSRQLALIADSDVSMQEGLAIISEKSDSRQIKRIGGEMIENLNKGVSFYDSVKGRVKTRVPFHRDDRNRREKRKSSNYA